MKKFAKRLILGTVAFAFASVVFLAFSAEDVYAQAATTQDAKA